MFLEAPEDIGDDGASEEEEAAAAIAARASLELGGTAGSEEESRAAKGDSNGGCCLERRRVFWLICLLEVSGVTSEEDAEDLVAVADEEVVRDAEVAGAFLESVADGGGVC